MKTKWTPEMDTTLIDLSEDGFSDKAIAVTLDTTEGSVRCRRYKLQRKKPQKHKPTYYASRVAKSRFGLALYQYAKERGVSLTEIAVATGFSKTSIYGASTRHSDRTISRFTLDCIADFLELNREKRDHLANAMMNDKIEYGKAWTK